MGEHCKTCQCARYLGTHDIYGVPLSEYHTICPECRCAIARSLLVSMGGLCLRCRHRSKSKSVHKKGKYISRSVSSLSLDIEQG